MAKVPKQEKKTNMQNIDVGKIGATTKGPIPFQGNPVSGNRPEMGGAMQGMTAPGATKYDSEMINQLMKKGGSYA